MKKIHYYFILGLLFIACNKDDSNFSETELTGKWVLKELYVDPGDGSGKFKSVNSNKQLEFHDDGTVTSNGSLCQISADSDMPSEGTYSTIDSIIHPDDCDYNIQLTLKNSSLIIYKPCFEGCAEKYKRP